MKRWATIILSLVFFLAGELTAGQVTLKPYQQEYLDKCVPLARQVMANTGVPVCISLAQAIVESGWGTSTIAKKANNHFCIKCSKAWKGKCFEHPDDKIDDQFRVYKSIYDSFEDYGEFLRYNKRYAFLFDLDPNDYKSWAYGLKQAGYATAPTYATTLIATIEKYDLVQYNSIENASTGKRETVETPVTVAKLEKPEKVKPEEITGESYSYSITHDVFKHNGTKFVLAEKGETYESIARAYNIFPREIYAFNDVPRGSRLKVGARVYIQPKKNRAAKGLNKIIVSEDGISLWSISQEYAVKLSSLCRRNGLKKNTVLSEGDVVLLR